jgi:hypothetical protein
VTPTPAMLALGLRMLDDAERTAAIRDLNDVVLTARQLLAELDSPLVDFTTDRVRSLTDDAAAAARRLYSLYGIQRATRLMNGDGE